MIVDSHMHVGDFPLFGASMARSGTVAEMPELLGGTRFNTPSSGIPMLSRSRLAVLRLDPDRVLCDSETSFHHPSVELAQVRVSALATDLTECVLGENGRAPSFGEQTRGAGA